MIRPEMAVAVVGIDLASNSDHTGSDRGQLPPSDSTRLSASQVVSYERTRLLFAFRPFKDQAACLVSMKNRVL